MKKILILVVLCFLFVGEVSAQYGPVFMCRASSPYAYGVGYSNNTTTAGNIALAECSSRTPYGYYCVINFCRRES